jgi:hypothetical protein
MALSKEWTTATEIYKLTSNIRDFSKSVYKTSNGFEAFIIGESTVNKKNDCWLIEDSKGIKSKIWKKTSKPRIKKVSSDYTLRSFTFSN